MNAPALVRSTKTFAHNLGAVDNRDKGTRIDLARIATQLHGLAPAQHTHDHRDALAGKCTIRTTDCCRAIEFLDDEALNPLRLLANHRTDLAQMDALNRFVDHQGLGKQPQHAIKTRARAV